MIDSGYVADFMELLLQTVVDTFTEAEVSLPERRYITFGTPAADGEQVTVALQQLYLGTPGLPPTAPNSCNSPTTGVFRVEILRAVPVPEGRRTVVDAETLYKAGVDTVTDGEILLRSIGALCGSQVGAMGIFADVSMPAEQGALGGPILTVTAGVP